MEGGGAREGKGMVSAHHVLFIFLPPPLPLSSGGRRLVPGGCSEIETKILYHEHIIILHVVVTLNQHLTYTSKQMISSHMYVHMKKE